MTITRTTIATKPISLCAPQAATDTPHCQLLARLRSDDQIVYLTCTLRICKCMGCMLQPLYVVNPS